MVGHRVREARRKARPPITQGQLAARIQVMGLKIGQAAISKIESGRRPVLDLGVVALARALGVPAGWLLGEERRTLP